jgi:hypothetical protein
MTTHLSPQAPAGVNTGEMPSGTTQQQMATLQQHAHVSNNSQINSLRPVIQEQGSSVQGPSQARQSSMLLPQGQQQPNGSGLDSRMGQNANLPGNGVHSQINGALPQQSPQITHPPSQQPIQPKLGILTPPDKLHPTLSCWIKNMNRLSSLIDRLQELASSAPAEHRPQLLRQVAALRTTFKKQQEHCVEFLTLSEEYANKYLLDISAEIQRQSSFLDKLEKRLEAAKKLRREAVDLQTRYESETVATMENLRATGKAASCRHSRAKLLRLLIFSTSTAASGGPCPVQRGELGANCD